MTICDKRWKRFEVEDATTLLVTILPPFFPRCPAAVAGQSVSEAFDGGPTLMREGVPQIRVAA